MDAQVSEADDPLERLIGGLPADTAAAVRSAVDARIERATREVARRLQLAQEAGRVGTYEIDLRTGISHGSPQFYRAFGLPENSGGMESGIWQNLIHPDDWDRVLRETHHALRSGSSDNRMEYRVVSGGAVRWIRSCDRIERDSTGRATLAFGAVIDVTEERMREAELWRAANQDPLTGLSNRRRFRADVEELAAKAERIGLLMIDLDGLKAANDMHGHAAGDHLICAAADRLRGHAPEGAALGRLGGDEFAFAMAVAGADELEETGAAMVNSLKTPLLFGDRILDCSGSVGGALQPDHALGAEALMQAADMALMVTKLSGRGRCRLWRPGDDAELAELTRSGQRVLRYAA